MVKTPKPAPPTSDLSSSGSARRDPPRSDLPLFYRSVRPLDSARDAGTVVKTASDFSFARATNAVPLNAVEYIYALRHYPIVFSDSAPLMTLAVLGIREDANLFVDAHGEWRKGAYIPAYVRRYPFIFIAGSEADKYTLGIDERAPHVGADGGAPLFVNGQPSEPLKHALAFCSEYQTHIKLTQDFCEAVKKRDLLVGQNANFEFKSGERARIQGFQVIDEAKFRALPDDVILEWRRNGYLPLIFAHLFSMRSWAELLDAAAEAEA